jgi:Fe2+ transport system protein FeoA
MRMALTKCDGGTPAIVREIHGGRGTQRRLNRLGIHAGDPIRMLRGGFFGGQVLVEIHGVEIGISRGVAEKVEVETTP